MVGSGYPSIYCLYRDPKKIGLNEKHPANLEIIQGDLLQPSSYTSILKQVDTVIHLAAVTGKTSREEYSKVIGQGTRKLLSGCQEAGVRNILYISTIAVNFQNKKRYFYAHSKQEAEEYVRQAGLNYTILRPTIILGGGSPVFAGFSLFAGLPVVPIFGRGDTKIQPVHAEDVVRVILHILEHSVFNNTTLELGGPQVISIREFLKMIHRMKKGKTARFIRFPMGMTVFLLSVVEPLLYSILPFTLGQLATFRNDGTAKENEVQLKLSAGFKNMEAMINDSMQPQQLVLRPSDLEKECRIFCSYLLGKKANAYILDKYTDCHRRVDMSAKNEFDNFLVKKASKNTLLTKLCDSYSRFFYPRSLLRKKLIYLLAILETSSPYSQIIDRSDEKGKSWLGFQIIIRGLGFAFSLFFSFFFLFPFQILLKSKSVGNE